MNLSPQQARAIYDQGVEACAQGRIDEAVEQARSLVASEHEGWGWALGGLVLRAQHDWPGARQALEEATLFAPLPAEAACALGECYLREEKPELARVVFRHLVLKPDLPYDLLAPLASGLGRLGEYELALAICREAAARTPERDEPLYAMAFFLRRLRRPPEVILSVLQQALRLAPESDVYRLAVAMLHEELGDVQAAGQVLAKLTIEHVRCENCLKRMHAILDRAGDSPRRDACLRQIEQVRAAADASDPCHRNHSNCRRNG
jgi:tetratricopeptide (TPR) repeat protein